MLFENFHRRNKNRNTVTSCVPKEYDYSHLVDRPVEEQPIRRPGFDGMLSEYDRVLLKFGMHIVWES